jgi:hypothetical protein
MKTIEEIKYYFRTALANDLKRLDRERRKVIRQSVWFGLVLLLAIGIIVFILFIYLDMIVAPLIICFALLAYCWALIVERLAKKYHKDYQDNVLKKLIEFVDKDLAYHPHGGIPEYFFKQSAIFRRIYNRYEGENLVCGKIDALPITSSYLCVKRGNYESWGMSVFVGLMFIVEINKPVAGKTVVISKMEIQESPFLSFALRTMEKWHDCDPIIKTDHCEFEKHFVTHGNSVKLTRNLLSPELMEAILDFTIKQKSPLFLSFLDSKMYVAISDSDPFSPVYFQILWILSRFNAILNIYHFASAEKHHPFGCTSNIQTLSP